LLAAILSKIEAQARTLQPKAEYETLPFVRLLVKQKPHLFSVKERPFRVVKGYEQPYPSLRRRPARSEAERAKPLLLQASLLS